MSVDLANVPENWVYSTFAFSKFRTKQLLAALPVKAEELVDKHTFLIIPEKGQEKAVRIICSRLFIRVRAPQARRLLLSRTKDSN